MKVERTLMRVDQKSKKEKHFDISRSESGEGKRKIGLLGWGGGGGNEGGSD